MIVKCIKYLALALSGVFVFSALKPENKIKIFMIGDSTMANKDISGGKLERGWGMMLRSFFTDDIIVDNYALNGRSSKSFITEGHWQRVFDQIKPGDYVFIQFGHNDEKKDTARHTEPGSTFDENLRKCGPQADLHGAVVRRRAGHGALLALAPGRGPVSGDRDSADFGHHDVSGGERRGDRDQHHAGAGGQPQYGEQPEKADLQVAGQRFDDHRGVRVRLGSGRGCERDPRCGVARAVDAARRHRVPDDLQVLVVDDADHDAGGDGRGELSGVEQDSGRQAGQRAEPCGRRGSRFGDRRSGAGGSGERRSGASGRLRAVGRAAGPDHRRGEREHPERDDRHRQ